MLILQIEDIEYCHLSHLLTYPVKPINGLRYQGHLFVEIKSYAQDQFQNAIKHCRELLEKEASVLPIIVKEATGFTLWSEDKHVQLLNQQNSPVVTQKSRSEGQTKEVTKYRGVEISSQVEKLSSPQTAMKIKYRGVEIASQSQKLPTSQVSVKSELKYRGRSCL